MLKVVHSVPGRLRLQNTHLRGNAVVLEALNAEFWRIDGVLEVRSNPATGSVVIVYDNNKYSSQEILRELDSAGHLASVEQAVTKSEPSLAQQIAETASAVLVEALVKRSTAALVSALI